MNKQFCTYKISLKLKELGFDEPCLGGYLIADEGQFAIYGLQTNHEYLNEVDNDDWLNAPLWQQAIDWLREEHNVCLNPRQYPEDENHVHFGTDLFYLDNYDEDAISLDSSSWYEAREKAILHQIETIKQQKI